MPIEDIFGELLAYLDLELQKKSRPEGPRAPSGCTRLALPVLIGAALVVVLMGRLALGALLG